MNIPKKTEKGLGKAGSWLQSPVGLALLAVLATAVFVLGIEHSTHFLGNLPFLLLVAINVAAFIIFALSLVLPRTNRQWRSFGVFIGFLIALFTEMYALPLIIYLLSGWMGGRYRRGFGSFAAFLVALFTEMYSFPLTVYLLSGWMGSRYPGLDLFPHNPGHLWDVLLGWRGDPHLNPLHLLSNVLIVGGFILLAAAWKVLHEVERDHTLAVTGPYAHIRHPQYVSFVLIMFGFLLQWPTLITLVMFLLLVPLYVRLSFREEREALAAWGGAYTHYTAKTPAFFPRLTQASNEVNL